MDPLLQLRPASAADVNTLIDLRARMLIELGSDDPTRLEDLAVSSAGWLARAFAEGGAVGWLVERNGVVVGGVTMTLTEVLPQYRSPNGHVATILGLYVVPDERGVGLAHHLVSEAVAHAREWGADVVVLHSAVRARPIYERCGFKPTKEMRLQFTESDDENQGGGCCV